jgi:hypothetical protein
LILWTSMKICENKNVVKIGQKYRTLYRKTWFHCSWRRSVATKQLSLTEMVSGCSPNCPCFLSICPPACIGAALIGRIYVKFNTEDSCENLSRNSKFD